MTDDTYDVIVVDGEGDEPSYGYTVGGIPIMGGELLFIGNVPQETIAGIVNHFMGTYKAEGGYVDDVNAVGTLSSSGGEIRHRVIQKDLIDFVVDYLVKVNDLFPDFDEETPVYILEIGDENNVLPGEDGYNENFLQFSVLEPEETL